jgi:hypothetical protein
MVETTTIGREETTAIESGQSGLSFEMDQMSLYDAIKVFKSMGIDQVLISGAKDGIRIAGMDDAHVSMCVEYIDAKRCVKYTNNDVTFGINLSDLKGVLMYVKGRIKVSQNKDMITVSGADGFVKTFQVLGEQLTVKIPQINYSTGAVVSGKQFHTALRVAADMADMVTLTADKNNLIMSATREKTEMELPVKILKGDFKGEEGMKSSYTIEKLEQVARNFQKGDVMVRFITTAEKTVNGKTKEVKAPGPLKLNFKIGETGDDVKGYTLIAPRAP